MGYKKMTETEYKKLSRTIENARQIIGPERSSHVERAYDAVEKGLILLGVSSVEDRLQEGVQETLESLRVAGIKVSQFLTKKKWNFYQYIRNRFKKMKTFFRIRIFISL